MKATASQPTLTDADDLLHRPTDELKWRESYYFNWVDLENKVYGFSTIGLVPNEHKMEFVFILFFDNKMEVYYKEPNVETYSSDINSMLSDDYLAYKMIQPLKTWEIQYKCRKFDFTLTFNPRAPPYDFGTGSSASWQRHFEVSGAISGTLKMRNGTIKEIHGFGQRDKSWGFRDWHQFDQWFAGHFQFKDWSGGFRQDFRSNVVDLSGYIFSKGMNVPIVQMKIETLNDSDQLHTPLTSTYAVKDSKGQLFTTQSNRIVKNSYMRFMRTFPGGFTELFEEMVIMQSVDTGETGTGLAEYLRTTRTI